MCKNLYNKIRWYYIVTNPILKKSDIVYHTRILPTVGIYDLDELKIRTVEETYFVGVEKRNKTAFLLPYTSIGKTVFLNRKEALQKIREAEKNKVYVG
ncbi:MAG: hypothetical protein IJE43_25640 [Alphaproteobacteria bacterium]|nr:hypothetical protein [Alphaproteobacteria bacterium]MBQ3514431.1 hypothetical protein [Lachnospiraceae bacterium]